MSIYYLLHPTTPPPATTSYVYSQWSHVPGLVVTGPAPSSVPRLPIFSLVFTHPPSGKLLHHNFICAILSDLFGIQARGGCSCAGPYAQVRYREEF